MKEILQKILETFYDWTGNYGIALLLLLLLFKLIFFPLTIIGQKNMIKNQLIMPKQREISEKHKNDPQKRNSEIMKLYQDHDMSPMAPLLSCIPLLVSYPVIIGLFTLMRDYFSSDAVQAQILWVSDISIVPKTAGTVGYLILPFLVMFFQGLSMFVSTKVNNSAGTGSQNTPASMKYIYGALILMIGFFAYRSIAALSFYWMIFSLLSILEQTTIKKLILRNYILELRARETVTNARKK